MRRFERGSDREADDKVTGGLSGHGFVPPLRRANHPMRLSLTGLSTRLRKRVDRAAQGTDVPAGIERGDAAATASPTGSRERGRMRRRLRELRRLREAQLLELGA